MNRTPNQARVVTGKELSPSWSARSPTKTVELYSLEPLSVGLQVDQEQLGFSERASSWRDGRLGSQVHRAVPRCGTRHQRSITPFTYHRKKNMTPILWSPSLSGSPLRRSASSYDASHVYPRPCMCVSLYVHIPAFVVVDSHVWCSILIFRSCCSLLRPTLLPWFQGKNEIRCFFLILHWLKNKRDKFICKCTMESMFGGSS